MRTLTRNQTTVWLVPKASFVDVLDADGNKTGEQRAEYGATTEVSISMYPVNGTIAQASFGNTESFDMVAVSIDVELGEKDYIFLAEPVDNYDKTYDYIVSSKLDSINNYSYGFNKRV